MKSLAQFLRDLLRLLQYLLHYFFGLGRDTRNRDPCRDHCPPALKRPDPFLYAQYFLMGLGIPVTWDNPDIYIFDGKTPVDPHNLKASTDYTLVARVWNNSTDVPVVDLNVVFSYLSFGMGVTSHAIAATTTDLNAKGLPGCPAFAAVKWTTPPDVGHYCVQVLLQPPDDSNWLNNLGQRNMDVAQAASPAAFAFDVGNHAGPRQRHVRFTVDTYTIPPLRPCDERVNAATRARELRQQAPGVPAGWTVQFTPGELVLAPGEEKTVKAEITPPPGFKGTMPFNVTAHDNVGPFGGVTLTVEVP